ncbi:MAG: hypothetical protein H6709_08805 [Kofleriaceae bacterium]|nr:hypothetical protein [Myxococcales bacterium]MCB9565180.1 hypothetical protein [Kofleriaceae bacterium]MCB9572169.1 hypothetical protein [Kofleriaceae bacterium]
MTPPSTLRLPFAAAARFRLEQLLVTQLACSWSVGWRLREQFALSGPELEFARVLLERRRNLWLYRCNQRHFCGDFLAIDMSAPRRRTTYALELKAAEPVRVGVGGRQFAGLATALAEVAEVRADGPLITAQGDGAEVLRWIGR